jgi:inorganic pyrophosphatase
MPDFFALPIGERCPEVVNAVIEVPLGSVNKYEYDEHLQVFRLDRTLYSPVHYPGDYGFIPSTWTGDGDTLDVLVLVEQPSFPGCVMEVRPIGMLEMTDQGARDEKVLAVANHNPRYREVKDYREVYPHVIREIEHFFSIYKDLEMKRTRINGWRDVADAYRIIQDCHKRYLGKVA